MNPLNVSAHESAGRDQRCMEKFVLIVTRFRQVFVKLRFFSLSYLAITFSLIIQWDRSIMSGHCLV